MSSLTRSIIINIHSNESHDKFIRDKTPWKKILVAHLETQGIISLQIPWRDESNLWISHEKGLPQKMKDLRNKKIKILN